MNNLPKFTIIGNPLYFPVRKDDGSYELNFQAPNAGLWVAATPEKYRKLPGFHFTYNEGLEFKTHGGEHVDFLEGSLHVNHGKRIRIPIVPPFLYIHQFVDITLPTSMENLIKKEFVEPTNYVNFFKNQGFGELDYEISQIPPEQKTIYSVTEKGHNKVAIAEKGGKPKISRLDVPEGEVVPIRS